MVAGVDSSSLHSGRVNFDVCLKLIFDAYTAVTCLTSYALQLALIYQKEG
jgi:hypothetical protein